MYALNPGYVNSVSDGERHWISAPRLAELYRIPPRQWFEVTNYRRGYTDDADRALGLVVDLYPRDDGNYTLPDKP